MSDFLERAAAASAKANAASVASVGQNKPQVPTNQSASTLGSGTTNTNGKKTDSKTKTSITDRVGKLLSGSGKQYAGSMVDAAGTAYEGGIQGASNQREWEIRELEQRIETARQTYNDAMARYGADNANAKAAAQNLRLLQEELNAYKAVKNDSLYEVADKVYGTADKLTASGAGDIEKAKEGLGKVGRFAVDAGVAGTQLLGDIGLGLATGGMASIPMALRSFGGAAGEARRNGATYEEQVGYGAASAALEFATEKLFGGDAGVYGKGLLDNVSQKVLSKLQSSPAGKAALNVLGQMGQEGAEEALASVVTPLLQGIYNDKSLSENWDEVKATDVLYDALIGAVLGGAGAVVSGNKPLTGEDAMLRDTADGTPSVEAKQPVAPTTPAQPAESANNATAPTGNEMTPPTVHNAQSEAQNELNNQVEQAAAMQTPQAATTPTVDTAEMLASMAKPSVETANVSAPTGAPVATNTPAVDPVELLTNPTGATTVANPTAQVGQTAQSQMTTAEATMGAGSVRERAMSEGVRTNEANEAELRQSFTENPELYTQLTNAEVIQKADTILAKGYEEAKNEVREAIGRAKSGYKLAPEYAIAAQQIANEMTANGNVREANSLMADVIAEFTFAGQFSQIAKVVRQSDPMARRMAIQKLVGRLNDDLSKGQRRKNAEKGAIATGGLNQEAVTAAVNTAKAEAIERTANAVSADGEWTPFQFPEAAAKEVADSIKKRIKSSLAPPKNKTALDTFVGYVKKFANEKVNLPKKKVESMTSTELLGEIVQNEDLFREVYEKAQAEFMGIDSAGYREFVESYLQSPVGLDGTGNPTNKILAKAIAESALDTNENAKYIQEQSALGVPNGEIASVIANDLVAKTKATGSIAESIKGAAESYVSEILAKDTVGADARVEKKVSEMMRNIGARFREVAVQDASTKESIRQDIADMLAIEYALSPDSAKNIAESVSNEYDRQLQTAISKELEARYKPKDKTKKPPKELSEKLTEAINLGAFNSEYANEAVKKVFGVEGDIAIPDELLDRYVAAQNDSERTAVMNEIEQEIANQIPATFRDKIVALRYLNMLGNFKTQGRNIVGNLGMAGATIVKRKVQAAAELGAAIATRGKYERTTSFITSPELRKAASADFANVKDVAMGDAKYADAGVKNNRGIENKRVMFGSGESAELLSSFATKAASKIAGKEVKVDVKKNVVEDARRLTRWAMEMGDQIFIKFHYTQALAGWMQAHGIKDLSQATPEQLASGRKFAIKEAQEATFRDDNAVSDFVVKLGKNTDLGVVKAIADGVVPFRKTPANVAVRAVEYSPLGFVKALATGKKIKDGKASAADVINDIAKGTTGTALAVAGFILSSLGVARGSEEDEKLAAFQQTQGQMDYSIKLGDDYISLSQFAPMSIPFFMGVKLNEIAEAQEGVLTLDTALELLDCIKEPMLEMSMLSGVNDALNNVSDFSGDNNALAGFLSNAIMSYFTQIVTNTFVSQMEQASEENRQTIYQEDKTSFDKFLGKQQYNFGKVMAKIPGEHMDYHQQDYVDAWGRTQSNGSKAERIFNAFLNPTYTSEDRSTEVDAELERLYRDNKGVEGFNENIFPTKRPRNATYGDGKVMTADEYLQFSKDSGQMKLELVSDFIGSEQYANLDDKQRAEVINNLYQFADDRALKKVKAANGVNAKSDWDEEAALPNLPKYLSAKTAYADATDAKNESPNYAAVDAVLATIGSMDKATLDMLDVQSGFKNLRFAYEAFGMDAETALGIDKMLDSEQGTNLKGSNSGVADAAVIAKNYKGTDAKKLQALEVANLPASDDGQRASIVRRTEAAIGEGISFDDWARIEAYVDKTKTSSNPNKATVVAAGNALGFDGNLVYKIYKTFPNDEDKVTKTNDYFSKDYVAPEDVDILAYLTGMALSNPVEAPTSSGGQQATQPSDFLARFAESIK